MLKVTLSCTLKLAAPFITRSTDIGAFGIDAPLARLGDKRFYFPRKLIKGCLRQAINELLDATLENEAPGEEDANGKPVKTRVERWFGDKSTFEKTHTNTSKATDTIDEIKTSVNPERAQLLFSDFIIDDEDFATRINTGLTSRISIDSDLGAVKDGHLLVIETPFEPGQEVNFHGTITYFSKDDNESKEINKWVSAGLRWISNLGAYENIDFGRIVSVKIPEPIIRPIVLKRTDATGADTFDLILVPRDPFCISKRRTTQNLFESEVFIPGGVIKGAFAETLKMVTGGGSRFKLLEDNLYRIRFTQALPSKTYARPVVAPLSLVTIKPPAFYDVANFKDPGLISVAPTAPAFSMDWKNREAIDKAFGWDYPERILSVQTAIENNRAKKSQLYAYEKVDPKGFQWLGRVYLGDIDKEIRSDLESQLRVVLEQGLFGIGKTKAYARVELKDKKTITDVCESNLNLRADNKYVITLQSPALLCDPRELGKTSSKHELFISYKKTWDKLSNHSLELSHFFASQSLAGGEYLYKRFQGDRPYNPYLLTEAGSVFIFDVVDESTSRDRVGKWITDGLPLTEWVKELYGLKDIEAKDYWRRYPYLPENGYGEISVNLDVHWTEAPKPGEYHEIP